MRGAKVGIIAIACLLAFLSACLDFSSEDAKRDTDNDGLPDAIEKRLGTNLSSADTDRDGIDDWLEANAPKEIFGGELPSPAGIDIYVEVQHMAAGDHTHEMPLEAKEKIIKIFADAPVKNYDGTRGIRLHIYDGGAVEHADPVTDDAYFLSTRAAINGWDNLRRRWLETSPRSKFFHQVVVAHYLDDEETFLASRSPGNGFAVAGARLKTSEDWVVAFTLGVARNSGADVESLDFSSEKFWREIAAGTGLALAQRTGD